MMLKAAPVVNAERTKLGTTSTIEARPARPMDAERAPLANIRVDARARRGGPCVSPRCKVRGCSTTCCGA